MNVPTSTYRLQVNADLPFARIRELIPYFKQLGVGALYLSPVFQARAHSPHGYDVTNPLRFNRELGDEAAFAQLSAALRAESIGLVLDIVPNHMAATEDNPWWRDLLKHGRASQAASFFDVDWNAPGCGERLVLPVLGEPLENALPGMTVENGEAIRYGDRSFPITPGTYHPGDSVKDVLSRQHYRLDYWRTGVRCMNYRRFFDVSELAGVRVEDQAVFATTHALILELIHSEQIDSVRVDHIDGLRYPSLYLQQLRDAVGDAYVVVEKILTPNEKLREDWPIQGTTGYDFVGMLAGFYCEPAGLQTITDDYTRRTGMPTFKELVYQKKRLVIERHFPSELNSLTYPLQNLARAHKIALIDDQLSNAIKEVSASLEVYRTYICARADEHDRDVIKQAVNLARHRAPNLPDEAYHFLRRILLSEEVNDETQQARDQFIAAWQQFTGPVMAKGLEDTAFYAYNRLIALSEVGAHPGATIASAAELHEVLSRRAQRWPHTMNASSTHDTKRSEDVRARLQVLSEMPGKWLEFLDRWLRPDHDEIDVNEQLLVVQTLLGGWPLDDSRLHAFLRKAAREAKYKSSWHDPDETYEQALVDFADDLLANEEFMKQFTPLQEKLARFGEHNSLSQLVLKLGAPGVPDFYQGTESWFLALVDPDNRRRVDFDALQQDENVKLRITRSGLDLRRHKPELFARGEYIPVPAKGDRMQNIFAFARRHENEWALFVCGRFYSQIGAAPLGKGWLKTRLELPNGAPKAWTNILTDEISDGRSLEAVFATLPVAILTGAS